jgi:hypothetical protein
VLDAPYFGCLSVCLSRHFLLLDGKMVDFGDCSRTVLAFFVTGNDVDEALSSWKMEVSL